MLSIDVPGLGGICWDYLVMDLNGTLTVDGLLIDGVTERLVQLGGVLDLHLLTADARGTAGVLGPHLGAAVHRVGPGGEALQKREFVYSLGAERVIAIGNGRNDVEMLAAASLGIAVVGPEGAAGAAIAAADVVCRDILGALDLLIHPGRLASTLRA